MMVFAGLAVVGGLMVVFVVALTVVGVAAIGRVGLLVVVVQSSSSGRTRRRE